MKWPQHLVSGATNGDPSNSASLLTTLSSNMWALNTSTPSLLSSRNSMACNTTWLVINLWAWTLMGTTQPTAATSACQAIYLCCFSNSSFPNLPNHGYLHISSSPSPLVLSLTSHLILTLQNSLILATNAAFKKLLGHCCTMQGRLISNSLFPSAPLPPTKPRPPLPQNKRWTSSLTMLLPIQMTA
jgi:hypothetical protein